MSGGRPTSLTPELIERARGYFTYWKETNDVVPSVEGLALYLQVARSTVYLWATNGENPEGENAELLRQFSDIYNDLLNERAKLLQNSGLSGRFNPTITKLLLSKHGYIEETKQDVTSGGEKLGVIQLPIRHEGPLDTNAQTGQSTPAT